MKDEQLFEILTAILETDHVKQLWKERDIREEIEFYGYQRRNTDIALEALEDFFEQDLEEIFKIKHIWLWLKEQIRGEVEYLTGDVAIFNERGIEFEMHNFVEDKLKDLKSELSAYYERLLNEEWQNMTVKQAKVKLPKGQQYVALLDKDGKLTREPYPITRDITANLTWEIRIDEHEGAWHKVKERNLHILSDKTLNPKTKCTGVIMTLKDNETAAAIIKN